MLQSPGTRECLGECTASIELFCSNPQQTTKERGGVANACDSSTNNGLPTDANGVMAALLGLSIPNSRKWFEHVWRKEWEHRSLPLSSAGGAGGAGGAAGGAAPPPDPLMDTGLVTHGSVQFTTLLALIKQYNTRGGLK